MSHGHENVHLADHNKLIYCNELLVMASAPWSRRDRAARWCRCACAARLSRPGAAAPFGYGVSLPLDALAIPRDRQESHHGEGKGAQHPGGRVTERMAVAGETDLAGDLASNLFLASPVVVRCVEEGINIGHGVRMRRSLRASKATQRHGGDGGH